MAVIIDCADGVDRERAVSTARAAARRGDLIVVPTESVYAIATDAFSARGLAAMRAAKGYEAGHPLPVMVGSRTTLAGIARGTSDSAQSLSRAFWPGPLTLLLEAQPSLAWDQPSQAPLAVRMPLHPLLLDLLAAVGPMAVTAAGLPGLPDPETAVAAIAMAGAGATVVLDAGPLTAGSLRSTVLDVRQVPAVMVREGSLSASEIEHACAGSLG